MKLKKALAMALTVAMTMTGLVACGSSESTDTTGTGSSTTTEKTETAKTDSSTATETSGEVEAISLKVWAPEEDMEITQAMMDSFQQEHPEWDITWDLTVIGVDESAAALTTDPDAAADVFLLPSGSIPELVEAGLLYPITANMDDITALYSENALEACKKDGLLYGLPSTPNCWFMWYNKSLYDESDLASLETMMAKDLGDGVYNFSCTIHNSWYIEAFYYAAGCTLFGPDGEDPTECSWNDANGMAATKYLLDLTSNPKYVEDEDGIAGSLFKEGKLGALCAGTWVRNDLYDAIGDDLGAVPLPTININGKDSHLSNFADYKVYAIKSNTKAPLAAQLFAEWLNNQENQITRFLEVGTTPTVLAVLDVNEAVANDAGTAALLAQTQYATAQPAISQIGAYWTPAETLGTAIVNKELNEGNAQEYLDKTVSDITTNLVE